MATSGAFNAFATNQVLGAGRFKSDRYAETEYDLAFRFGQLAGDVASIVTGAGEIVLGDAMLVGGAVGAPFSFGSSLSISVVGAGIAIHGTTVASPVLKGVIGGAIGGGAGGYAGGFTAGLLMTGDIGEANQAGLSGLATGFGIGATAGGVSAYASAKANGINPWTGRLNNQEGSLTVRHHTSGESMESIRLSNEIKPSRLSDYDFLGVDFEATPNFDFNQNFGNSQRGAFIELNIPKSLLISNPSPLYPNFYRVNTGLNNFLIQPSYKPQYFLNIKF